MKFHTLIPLIIATLLTSGCASVWLTCHTGKTIYFEQGTKRSEIINILGEPSGRSRVVEERHALRLRYTAGGISSNQISHIENYDYKGKINSIDEGSGQAMANAITLGTGEIIALPITVVSIVTRSFGHHKIFVFYDDKDQALAFIIEPAK
jgi:hypothetical protein